MIRRNPYIRVSDTGVIYIPDEYKKAWFNTPEIQRQLEACKKLKRGKLK